MLYDYLDPPSGTIYQYENGRATGLISETYAFFIVWPHLARASSKAYNIELIRTAIGTYLAFRYTGAIEIAIDGNI